MRSITTFDLQYAHRFYGFMGEAQYLHGHTGVLTIEVEDSVNMGVNMVYPCNEIQKVAWGLLKNFDHALILREDDPLLPAVLDVYEKQGIKDGHPMNTMKGPAFKTELATAYPDCRLVVTKETLTVEGMSTICLRISLTLPRLPLPVALMLLLLSLLQGRRLIAALSAAFRLMRMESALSAVIRNNFCNLRVVTVVTVVISITTVTTLNWLP